MKANFVPVDHLPFGQKAVWLPDCNTVAVLDTLTPAECDEALDELQAEWRRTLRPSAPEPSAAVA